MNIAIASGDYPAIISNLIYSSGDTGALADDVIVDLTDYLEEYSPNYNYLIGSNPDEASIFRNDGRVLSYKSPYDNFIQNQGMVIRKDWLEEQNLEVPTTYEEMHNVLTTFRDALAAGDDAQVRDLLDRGRALREAVLLRQHQQHTGSD